MRRFRGWLGHGGKLLRHSPKPVKGRKPAPTPTIAGTVAGSTRFLCRFGARRGLERREPRRLRGGSLPSLRTGGGRRETLRRQPHAGRPPGPSIPRDDAAVLAPGAQRSRRLQRQGRAGHVLLAIDIAAGNVKPGADAHYAPLNPRCLAMVMAVSSIMSSWPPIIFWRPNSTRMSRAGTPKRSEARLACSRKVE